MKISDKLTDGLNRQVTVEFESAYLYLTMADYLNTQSLYGMEHWFRAQAAEEKNHALRINDYLLEMSKTPEPGNISSPKKEWTGIMSLFENAYNHECDVTAKIYDLVAQALEDKDFGTMSFLQWLVDEQREDENKIQELMLQARMINDLPAGLLILDQKMAERKE